MARKRYASDDPDYRRKKKAGHASAPAPRSAARTRRSQLPPPSAPAGPALPSKVIDFGAFTRERGAVQAPPVPPLAELATVESAALADVDGGACPRCAKPHGDDDRHCQHCGAALRRACSKCDRPLRDDQAFCPACGVAAPVVMAEAEAEAAELQAIAAAPAAAPVEIWEPDDLFWVSSAVDVALVRMDAPLLEDKPRDRINARAAAVANKHFRVGGKWKEEIQLGMAIAGAIFPAAYIHFVIVPDERRRAEKDAEAAARGVTAEGKHK